MLPNKPKFTREEKKSVRDLFGGEKYSTNTKWLIRELVFGSDEFFNVLTPFQINIENGKKDYLRSAFDVKVGMELEKDGKKSVVDQELTSDEKLLIEALSNYYKAIRESIREENFSDTPFFHIPKRDLNLINKRAKELVQELIDEVSNG
jgi:hypothetical protein